MIDDNKQILPEIKQPDIQAAMIALRTAIMNPDNHLNETEKKPLIIQEKPKGFSR
jgi:hypothetical protein